MVTGRRIEPRPRRPRRDLERRPAAAAHRAGGGRPPRRLGLHRRPRRRRPHRAVRRQDEVLALRAVVAGTPSTGRWSRERQQPRWCALARRDLARSGRAFTFLHLSLPDVVGHAHGFMSPGLPRRRRPGRRAWSGRLLRPIAPRPPACGGTRGGPHRRPRRPRSRPRRPDARWRNYRVPFLVWGPASRAAPTSTTSTPTTPTPGGAGPATPPAAAGPQRRRGQPRHSTCSACARARQRARRRSRTSTSADARVARRGRPAAASGPELALEPVLGLVDGALVGAGGEVLPAAVADDEGDVGALPALTALAAWPSAACRIAPVEMPAKMPSSSSSSRTRRTASRGPTENRESISDGVVQLGDEALVEVAQAVDQLAVARLGGDDPHAPASRGGRTGRRPSGCRWCRGRRRSG